MNNNGTSAREVQKNRIEESAVHDDRSKRNFPSLGAN